MHEEKEDSLGGIWTLIEELKAMTEDFPATDPNSVKPLWLKCRQPGHSPDLMHQ